MKIKHFSITLLMVLGAISGLQAQTYEQLWKQVEVANNQGKPQTAIQLTTDIFKKAEKEKVSAQMLKAYMERSEYRNSLTPDSFYVDLKEMEQWAATADKPLDRAVIHSLIAGIYANYVEENSWQLNESNDIVGEEPPADIREWSRNMFTSKVLKNIREALKDTDLLLNMTTQGYIPFVTQGATSSYYKHDMYHMLGILTVESLKRVRLNNDTIAKNEIESIFQRMMVVYDQRKNTEAQVLTTLRYLEWQNGSINYLFDDETEQGAETPKNRYIVELDKLISRFKSKEICAEVYLAKAQYLKNEQSLSASALQICEEAIGLYPAYKRINALKQLKQDILNPELTVMTSRVVYPGIEFKVHVTHRNQNGFTVLLYRVNMTDIPSEDMEITDAFYAKHTSKLSEQRFSLLRTTDYQSKDTVFTLKAPDEGCYVMRVIPDEKVKNKIGEFLYSTRFSILSRALPRKQSEVIALDNESGHPIPNTTIAIYSYDGKLLNTLTTGVDGKIVFDQNDKYKSIRARKENDKWMPHRSLWQSDFNYHKAGETTEMVQLLTDRTLYRPGQTVYVKGIAYTQQLDTAKVTTGKSYTLTLLDVNGQEVARKSAHTNEFGSFSTTFALPAVCLNGYFTVRTDHGEVAIKVEEYKRPTFDITFDKMEGSYRLGDNVQVKGQAKTFSGVPLQDLKVQYVINRYYAYKFGLILYPEMIGSGTTTLAADGTFSVPLSLKGRVVRKGRTMSYRFQVEATITNAAGETQTSSYSLSVGEHSLFLSTDLDMDPICRDKPINITFKAVNLDNQPVKVEGAYNLYPVTDTKKYTHSDEAIRTGTFVSNQEIMLKEWQSLPSGAYTLVFSANDAQGREVKEEKNIQLFSLKDERPAIETPLWSYEVNTNFDTTHPGEFYFGTSFKNIHVLMTVLSGEKVLENKSIVVSDSILRFVYPYKEEYGDGLSFNFCFVRNKSLYQETVTLQKSLAAKNLMLKWDVFRDKLRPGQQEEWKLTVKSAQGTPVPAEMLALMYDASLDKIYPNSQVLQIGYDLRMSFASWAQPYTGSNNFYNRFILPEWRAPEIVYDSFYSIIRRDLVFDMGERPTRATLKFTPPPPPLKSGKQMYSEDNEYNKVSEESPVMNKRISFTSPTEVLPEASPNVRTNFSETAFFYPHLRTNEQGEISFSFTMPESLTRWNFRGFAHTKGMLTGMIDGEATTSKEFMLTPNLPRFVRVGDKTSVAATVANLTGNTLSGTVDLVFFNPITEAIISTQKQKFTAEAGQTTAVSFQFTVTDKHDVLGCRIVGDGGTFSDGEQHLLPVLSNKEVLTETVALPVRGQVTKTFSLEKLFNNHSKTASNQQLTVEFTADPTWYAVQALPALSQPTNDNAVSWATAYYANVLAAYIMNSQPRIQTVFDTWKRQGGSKETFLSDLQKNQEVKNILLSESPWVMEAKNEQQQKERIATLFDLNTISGNKLSAQTKLKELQLPDGSWPWYKGMNGSEYITTYIVGLNARLTELTGQPMEQSMLDIQTSALNYMDKQARKEYDALRKQEKEGGKITGISGMLVDYLYIKAISNTESVGNDVQQYLLTKAVQMIGTASMKVKAKLAVVFNKAGRTQDAQRFLVSLKEHLAKNDEMGMYFAFNENPYSWNGQAIPAHVAVMEAFDRVANDTTTVEEMKFWLLKQKQTLQWNSPVSTADAVYALLERGSNPTVNQSGARLTFGGKVLDTKMSQMAGVGYIKETFTDKRSVDAKEITVAKQGKGVAWGAVYARFEEKADQVKQQGSEMNIEKKLYVERLLNNVRQLELVTAQTKLAVGDKVFSRITIRTDRAMEFVQLKDQRGACFEPIENLSGYRWSNGFSYYLDVKDASTNFFFDGLGKGVFVLEYAYRVARAGTYDAGLATIQCAYAPEYASHSASMIVVSE